MAYLDPGEPTDLAARACASLEEQYAVRPAAVGIAPGRVNLIGEHTDYNRGLVLPVALPHSTVAAVAARTDGRVRIGSAQQDPPWEGRLADLGPDAVEGWAAYPAGVLWALGECLEMTVPGVDVWIDSSVPVGAGLSSSAAIECAVATAVAGLLGHELDPALRQRLAQACVRAETDVVGAPTGGMDQTVAMHAEPGSALLIDFDDDSRRPVPLDLSGRTLLVTDTRVSHELTDGGYGERRADCEEAAAQLGLDSLREAGLDDVARLGDARVQRRARHVVTEIGRVGEVVAALEAADWATVGSAFGRSHASMRDDFEISTPELDVAVAVAVEAGADAARMTGGGFGGSSVALVPDERVEAVMRAIDTAFALEGFRSPAHLRATPSAGARLLAPQVGTRTGDL